MSQGSGMYLIYMNPPQIQSGVAGDFPDPCAALEGFLLSEPAG